MTFYGISLNNDSDRPIDGSNKLFDNNLLEGRHVPSPGLWDEMRSFLAIAFLAGKAAHQIDCARQNVAVAVLGPNTGSLKLY